MTQDRSSSSSDDTVRPEPEAEGKTPDDANKTQDLAKAGRKDFDPDAGQE